MLILSFNPLNIILDKKTLIKKLLDFCVILLKNTIKKL